MKKIKFGFSFFLLIAFCLIFKCFALLLNYLSALLLHELSHFFVAKCKGYNLQYIKFDMFGLSLELNEKIADKDNFLINIAGPLCNMLIALICLALYWLIPTSYIYLNVFCVANITLAIFNLLPIYPLDGGKIFSGIIKSEKVYRILNIIIKVVFSCAFLTAFIFSLNWFYLICAMFFVTASGKRDKTISIFKFSNNKNFEKVVMIKFEEDENLFNLIKKIKNNHYTIFYNSNTKQFIDEESLIDLASKMPLTTTLKEIK